MYKGSIHDDNDIFTNVNVKITGATVTLPAGTLPVLDLTAVPSRYRMLSVPIVTDPVLTAETLLGGFGTGGEDWLAWQFPGPDKYNGYQPGHLEGGFAFGPGDAAWVGVMDPSMDLTVEGSTPDVVANAEITLGMGWNQFGNPYNYLRNWDDATISASDAAVSRTMYWFPGDSNAYSFASTDPTVPNQTPSQPGTWKTSSDFEGPATGVNWPGTIDGWCGNWVFSDAQGAKLRINPEVPDKNDVPITPAPPVQIPYHWSVRVTPEVVGTLVRLSLLVSSLMRPRV